MTELLIFNVKLFSAGDITSIVHSSIQETRDAKNFTIQASWSGSSPLGTLDIEVSLDQSMWTTVDTISITGSSGNGLKDYSNKAWPYMRVTYAQTSGTGTLTVNLSGKR